MLFLVKEGVVIGSVPEGIDVVGDGVDLVTYNDSTKDMIDSYLSSGSDEAMYLEKKKECREIILSRYSETDQMNNVMFGDDFELNNMKSFIRNVLDEFRMNGKNADFRRFL